MKKKKVGIKYSKGKKEINRTNIRNEGYQIKNKIKNFGMCEI